VILALAGGVGGARLANGLATAAPAGALTVVVNTGDDFEHLGLAISPDIDTVTYTLAGLNNPVLGWGRKDESWAFMDALRQLGGPDWFALGDRDLAIHSLRTQRLRAGDSLSAITADIAARLGIAQHIVPMSDDPVRSMVDTDDGELAFQDYFVRRRCEPRFIGIRFEGAATARPGPALMAALADPTLEAIVICPSNPLLSVAPILALPGVRDALTGCAAPIVAVSPFIGGKAVKGPAGKIMDELGLPATPAGLTNHYAGLIDGLVIDHIDAAGGAAIANVEVMATDTLMRDSADQARLAAETLDFARRVGRRRAR
jgi:LPPG:FO 2-phospho-L-lactate transferase